MVFYFQNLTVAFYKYLILCFLQKKESNTGFERHEGE